MEEDEKTKTIDFGLFTGMHLVAHHWIRKHSAKEFEQKPTTTSLQLLTNAHRIAAERRMQQ